MEFRLSEEQQAIGDLARGFFAERAPPLARRRALESEARWLTDIWPGLAQELGVLGVMIPEAYGGSGLGYVELAVLLQEAGRVLLPAPLFETLGLAVPALMAAADEPQLARWLPAIAQGALRMTLAFGGARGLDGLEAQLLGAAGDWRLEGRAEFVPFAAAANEIIVAARAPGSQGQDGVSLVAVPAGAPGLVIEPLVSLDLTRPFARLTFQSVRIDLDWVLGAPGEGGPALRAALDQAAAMLAADQVGGAEAALEMSVEYAKQRVQFGRPIGSFQAIKHKLADMMLLVRSARSAALWAAMSADDPELRGAAASAARVYCSDAFSHCAAEAIQIHGGIGFTWEHEAHLYFKRAWAASTLLGSADQHRDRLADLIGLGPTLAETFA